MRWTLYAAGLAILLTAWNLGAAEDPVIAEIRLALRTLNTADPPLIVHASRLYSLSGIYCGKYVTQRTGTIRSYAYQSATKDGSKKAGLLPDAVTTCDALSKNSAEAAD